MRLIEPTFLSTKSQKKSHPTKLSTMKNYFNFTLTGKKFLPVWLLFLVFFILPYAAMIKTLGHPNPGEPPSLLILPLFLLLIIVAFVITFYIAKLTIVNIAYKEKTVAFSGSFGKYTGIFLLGIFLSIITLGIYIPWFIRNIHRFLINNSSYESTPFNFLGKGGKLFLIFLLSAIIPMIALSVIMFNYMAFIINQFSIEKFVFQLIYMLIMIPYMYLFYRWLVNVSYKNYIISWETSFWPSCGKIAVEILLTAITLGIYYPLAMVRLYKYFADRTTATAEGVRRSFGYDIEPLHDFLFIWGQVLLSIITLGIYYPWAYYKIGRRILSKTYLEQ